MGNCLHVLGHRRVQMDSARIMVADVQHLNTRPLTKGMRKLVIRRE